MADEQQGWTFELAQPYTPSDLQRSERELRELCLCAQFGTRKRCQLPSAHEGPHDWEREST